MCPCQEARPLEVEHLLRKNEAVAAPVIGQRQFNALKKAVLKLEDCEDFREGTALLQPA